jgi:hypothetical protein
VFVYAANPRAQLHLSGDYDDGIRRSLGPGLPGTAWTSLAPQVATVDGDGLVTAAARGQATIRAACGGHAAEVQVLVESVPCTGDLDADGQVRIGDLIGLLASWGPCPGDPAPCDADLDGDGDVDGQDLAIILERWGPCE